MTDQTNWKRVAETLAVQMVMRDCAEEAEEKLHTLMNDSSVTPERRRNAEHSLGILRWAMVGASSLNPYEPRSQEP